MSETRPSRLRLLSALLAIQILFGVNYVVSKQVVEAFPPMVWGCLRILVTSALMFGTALALRRPHPPLRKEFFLALVPLALLGVIINGGLFLYGLRLTTATNSALLNTLIPVFTLLVVTLRKQESMSLQKGLGFLLSFAGVLALRRIEEFSFSNRTFVGDLLVVLNCVSYSLFLSYSKGFFERNDRIWATTWMFIYGSVGFTLLAVPDWAHFAWPSLTPGLLGAMAFSIVGGTVITYFLAIWTLAHASSSSVALFIYLQPVVASVVAWIWLDEILSLRTLLAATLIFGGVLFALYPAMRRTAFSPKASQA